MYDKNSLGVSKRPSTTKGFRVRVGRSSGNYSVYDVTVSASLNNPDGVFAIDPLFLLMDL